MGALSAHFSVPQSVETGFARLATPSAKSLACLTYCS
jgi:hypothetical protein